MWLNNITEASQYEQDGFNTIVLDFVQLLIEVPKYFTGLALQLAKSSGLNSQTQKNKIN